MTEKEFDKIKTIIQEESERTTWLKDEQGNEYEDVYFDPDNCIWRIKTEVLIPMSIK